MSANSKQSYTSKSTQYIIRAAFACIVSSFICGAYYCLNVKVLPDGTMYQPQISFLLFRVLLASSFGLSSYAAYKVLRSK